MNKQEALFFEALSKDRSEIADVLERRAVRGYKDSVVEKYSDQAHFIYELLQNADDACATNARFILEENRLIFAHNGTRHFSVSNPANEDIDSERKTLGDINAITSIANSNKTGASIGKFGVGFKAVFQYTSTPHIYDPSFKFKIERFIVPIKLDTDFPGRRADETLFVFPFDHQERDAEEAYNDISDKLKNLSFPLLFLTNLKGIEFEFGNVLGLYDKRIKQTITYENTTAEHIVLTQNDGDELYDEELWLFSRLDECERRYSVGFFMDEKGHLCPVNEPAFCFFPTKEVTNLNFILHAPFLLTDSREGIRAGVAHNDKLIRRLAELSADALVHLRDIGIDTSTKLIDDNIVDIIPTDEAVFSDPADKRKVSFLPFFEEIKGKLKSCAIIPSVDGYVESENAYWAAVPQLTQLFSNEQLSDITENANAQWVFVTLGRDEVQRNNKALFSYIEDLIKTNLNEDAIINGRSRDFYYNRILGIRQTLENVKGITKEFIEKQTISWLHDFYKWLSETKHRTDIITEKPIFLDQKGRAVAAFDEDNQLILFLPVKNVDGYTVVNDELLKNEETKKYIESIGVKQPSLKDQIYNIILPQYKDGIEIDTDPHFMIFFNFYCKCSNEEIEEFIDLIKDCEFLTYYEDGVAYRGSRECKVLVLTPTNKSADVLVRRIMEISKQDKAYEDWLVRFGGTGDEEIEQSPVFRDKTFDIRTLTKNVTVTTIARFPYDFFMPQGARVFLNGINWDYIIIDEASMIPLANIVYPLYKKTPKRFIIAGDPFQIEPITSVDLWKNENIYTMVHLDSFVKPETIPYQYKVELLTTQYRSVPDIGGIFSNFAYGGILKHNRSVESQRPLNVGNDLGIETLNIIKFPVSKYESIYRCKRLQHSSSYQVYSAIFTFEYVSYLSRAIAKNNPGELFKIGVIAPYRAQADMIDKLLASEKLPKEVDVQVGTIHGFQGDECDIIFAVFNTPPTISASKDMFLNKRNIINVSISRARDYLFVVMPDDDTDNISNLRLVKRVESLIQSTDAWNEFLTPDLEELMFGDAKYLENNAFSTSHQSVNVYGLPEKIYEVRTEDTAVDVQIHRSTSKKEEVDPTLASGTVVVDEPQYMDSYDLDESLIPEELRDTAIDLPVRGAINGWCYLVPYEGKLKSHTVKKVIGMFIPQNRNGQEKMVSVSVVKEDRIIYISKDMFKIYEQSLSEPDGIQLKRTFF